MRKVLILCEGPTEEQFIKQVLRQHLQRKGVWAEPVIIATKRVKSGGHFKGGIPTYGKVREEILRLLHDTSAMLVTTMIDYYGLPKSFPKRADPEGNTPLARVQSVEMAIDKDISNPRFKSYLSLHEFEALLFTSPPTIASAFAKPDLLSDLQKVRDSFSTPEEINEGNETAPSKRLRKMYPRYGKPFFGSLIAIRIGLEAIRQACGHFNSWVSLLEQA